ncbi:DUF1127 domain-containing protein [Bradyrhizobium sp.]|uniref:DUF1127 domain-containing protein n=1 Tax=Bradyrhizobium sp. TaxID=376 RepID=UPI00341FC45F
MSCGSTTCSSTNTLDATPLSFPDLGWSWKSPLACLARMAVWWEQRYQYRQLLELDDRLLADIGVSRTAAVEARRSHLYLMAWRDSR